MKALGFVFAYSKDNFKETLETRHLCSEIMVFLGNMTYENEGMQNLVRESGLLSAFCNHPLEYMMDPLKHLFVPALCSIIHQN